MTYARSLRLGRPLRNGDSSACSLSSTIVWMFRLGILSANFSVNACSQTINSLPESPIRKLIRSKGNVGSTGTQAAPHLQAPTIVAMVAADLGTQIATTFSLPSPRRTNSIAIEPEAFHNSRYVNFVSPATTTAGRCGCFKTTLWSLSINSSLWFIDIGSGNQSFAEKVPADE